MTTFFQVQAFTKDGAGGNAAGVVCDASKLSETDMLAIAAQAGFSETAFVCPSETADHRVRFFTPTSEVNLCGHATIATYHLLLERKMIEPGSYSMDTRAGVQRIEVSADGLVAMTQNPPTFGDILPPNDVARVLGVLPDDLMDAATMPVQKASTGLHKIFVPMHSLAALQKVVPDLAGIDALSRSVGAIGTYVFSMETVAGGTAHCRNFAPVVGIEEDSATGTSAAALSCLLHKYGLVDDDAAISGLVFEQGYAIEQPSEIVVRLGLSNGAISEVWVAGRAKTEAEHIALVK